LLEYFASGLVSDEDVGVVQIATLHHALSLDGDRVSDDGVAIVVDLNTRGNSWRNSQRHLRDCGESIDEISAHSSMKSAKVVCMMRFHFHFKHQVAGGATNGLHILQQLVKTLQFRHFLDQRNGPFHRRKSICATLVNRSNKFGRNLPRNLQSSMLAHY